MTDPLVSPSTTVLHPYAGVVNTKDKREDRIELEHSVMPKTSTTQVTLPELLD